MGTPAHQPTVENHFSNPELDCQLGDGLEFLRTAGNPGLSSPRCQAHLLLPPVELGANLRAVQELARHKQIEMTVRYAHLRNDYLGETVRILDTQPAGQKSGQKSLAASGKEPENT